MATPHTNSHQLAQCLCKAAGCGRADSHYRLARMVARVLVSSRLRRREKWCALARELAADRGVEERLVLQAIGWLQRGAAPFPTAA